MPAAAVEAVRMWKAFFAFHYWNGPPLVSTRQAIVVVRRFNMEISTIGVDLSKTSFHLGLTHGVRLCCEENSLASSYFSSPRTSGGC